MNSPLRIGLLTPTCAGYNTLDSGIGRHFADLAQGLSALGHHVCIVTPAPQPNGSSDIVWPGIRFAPFEAKMPRWLDRLSGLRWQLHALAGLRHRMRAASRELSRCVASEKLDLIETTSSGLLAGDYLRRRNRIPVVTRVSTTAGQLVAHNAGQSRWIDRIEQRWEEKLVRASDALITHTRHHRDELCAAWQLPPNTFTIIPHGIDVPADDELPVRPQRETVEVLFVGRFEYRKGIDVLLGAIPQIIAANPAVRFTLIGHDRDGKCQSDFLNQHPDLSADRVKFLGQVSEERLRAAYRDCDFFVGPSRYESFGLIYVEAMAWGKPVIACASGGTVEVVVNGDTGWLIAPGNTNEFVARTLDLAHDSERRARFGRNARQRVQRHFSRTAVAENSAAFYRQVLARTHNSGK